MKLTLLTGTLTKAYESDAGFDIHASESLTLFPGIPEICPTNLTVTLPPNSVAFIKPRSGLAFNNNIDTMAGVIDEKYSGEIKVLLINHGNEAFHIDKNQRIAQLVVLPVLHPIIECAPGATYNEPKEEQRSTNGFGSSGD